MLLSPTTGSATGSGAFYLENSMSAELEAKVQLLEQLVCSVTAEMLELKAEVNAMQELAARETAKRKNQSVNFRARLSGDLWANQQAANLSANQQAAYLRQHANSAADGFATSFGGIFGKPIV
jgi:hypothetical protein